MREWMQWIAGIGEDMEKEKFYITDRNENWFSHFRKQFGFFFFFRKLKIKLICDLAASVQGDWSQGLETFAPMLHYSVTHSSQSKPVSSISLWDEKTVCIVYTVKYGFFFRKKEILSFVLPWMNLEVILSGVSRPRKTYQWSRLLGDCWELEL